MPSPIFFPLFIKKYIVQIRKNRTGPWKDYETYNTIEQAERIIREMVRKNPELEGRIFNRLTSQVTPVYIAKK